WEKGDLVLPLGFALPSLWQRAAGEREAADAGVAETAAVWVEVDAALVLLGLGALDDFDEPPQPAANNIPAARQIASPRMGTIVSFRGMLRKVTRRSSLGGRAGDASFRRSADRCALV